MFSFFNKTPSSSKKSVKEKIIQIEEQPIKNASVNKIENKKSVKMTEFITPKENNRIIPKTKSLIPEVKISQNLNNKNFKEIELPDFLTKKEGSYKIMELSDKIAENSSENVLSKTFWSTGSFSQSFPFFLVSETLDAVSKQKGENSVQTKKDIISKLFSEAISQSPSELFILYNFLTCRFDADFKQKDVHIGNETLVKIIAKLSGKTLKNIREGFKRIGDLGILAEESRANQKTINTFFVPVKTRDMNMKVTLFNCFSIIKNLAEIRK